MGIKKNILLGTALSLFGFSSYFIGQEMKKNFIETGVNAAYSNNDFKIEKEKKAIKYLSDKNFNNISFNVRYFQKTDTSSTIDTIQTPSFENLSYLIKEAKERKLKVMLRPLINSKTKQSRNLFNPNNPDKWFSDYSFILERLAKFSENEKIDGLCIGVEIDNILMKHQNKFNILIKGVKEIYNGKIDYSISFFQEDSLLIKTVSSMDIDFLGVDYYVSIKNKQKRLMGFENKYYLEHLLSYSKKPIILSEVGYRSIKNSGKTPWNYMRKDEKDFFEQKDLYNSIFFALSHLNKKNKSKIHSVSFWIKDKRDFSQDVFETDTLGYSPFGKPAEREILDYNQKRKFLKNLSSIF